MRRMRTTRRLNKHTTTMVMMGRVAAPHWHSMKALKGRQWALWLVGPAHKCGGCCCGDGVIVVVVIAFLPSISLRSLLAYLFAWLRLIVCFKGAMVGDVLGSAVEGWSARDIAAITNNHGLRDFQVSKRGFGSYTDDTQMLLALGYSLVSCGHLVRNKRMRKQASKRQSKQLRAAAHSV